MIQQTSLEAWYEFQNTRFSRQEGIIYECLQQHPKISYSTLSQMTGLTINSVCGRMNCLRKKGAVMCVGIEVNPNTGIRNKVYSAIRIR